MFYRLEHALFDEGSSHVALARRRSKFTVIGSLLAAMTALAACDAAGAPALTSSEQATEFTVTDGVECDTVRSGNAKLSGTLKINFAGRILPHENTSVELYGNGVESLEGRFDRVELPEGWLGDVEYHDAPPAVTLRNLRPDRPPAFPGAEGFGKFAIGGRGGRVIAVTNLNDAGPGSLRAACEAEGPRTVVFRVSGTIPLESELKIKHPFLTIAGQTAPGDGICVAHRNVKCDAENVIIRYMRFRPGDVAGVESDGFGGECSHSIIDHCTVSWGTDETLSINKATNFTVQWCMITESLFNSLHKKGHHGYGGLWGGPGGSWHHNILAHHSSRNPRASGNEVSGLMDCRNNVIYNWGFNSAYGGEMWPRNWVNNYYKPGPATEPKVAQRIFLQKDARGRMFADGNFMYGSPEVSRDNWDGGIHFAPDGDATEQTLRSDTPYVVAPVRTETAEEAFESVLAEAGASLVRDAVDARIIEEIRTGTAQYGKTWRGGGNGIIDSQADVGGWPELKSAPAPADGDGDGMPDEWELAQRLDPKAAGDGALDQDGDGYTNLEEYLNSLAGAGR